MRVSRPQATRRSKVVLMFNMRGGHFQVPGEKTGKIFTCERIRRLAAAAYNSLQQTSLSPLRAIMRPHYWISGLLLGFAVAAPAAGDEKEIDGFVPMFNGRDL